MLLKNDSTICRNVAENVAVNIANTAGMLLNMLL